MIARTRPSKGRPLIFLATVALIWVAVRAIAWQMPAPPEATAQQPKQIASAPARASEVETVAAAEPDGGIVAAPATLVEGLEPLPSASEHGRFIDSSVAAGHDMLWMSASQD